MDKLYKMELNECRGYPLCQCAGHRQDVEELRADLGECRGKLAVAEDALKQARAENERLRGKLQRVRDWFKYAANSQRGICSEIDDELREAGGE